MFDVFVEEKSIAICMLVCMFFSIFLRVFLGLLYRNMIREADNMATTKNKLLKQCKLKFTNCFELSGGVSNIPVFVDKFLNRLSLGHLSFEMMYHLSGQTMLLSVVFAGVGVCRSIMKGSTLGHILPFYIVSFIGLYLYFSVSTIVDIKGKRRTLKVNLVDYLENHLSPRIDVTRQDMEMLYGEAVYRETAGSAGRMDARRRKKIGAGVSGRNVMGRRERRTVELMPIMGKAAGQTDSNDLQNGGESGSSRLRSAGESEGNSLRSAGESESDSLQNAIRLDSGIQNTTSTAVTGEELEALLREFLAT